MKLDPNHYRRSLDAVKDQLLESKDIMRTLSEVSCGTHVPLLALVTYAVRPDVLGPLPALLERAERLKSFYHYTDVASWDDLKEKP